MTDNKNRRPSLLEPQSQGGDTAESGFEFQNNMILCKIPFWLSFEGFDSIIREATADFEVKFFAPSAGIYREAVEAKSHRITPREFWGEITRFMELDEGSPGTYSKFTLCCSEISDELKPLISGLRRVREPQAFYDPESKVLENSYFDYVDRTNDLGKDESIARFLYEKVLIENNWSLNKNDEMARGIFSAQFQLHLPLYDELPQKEIIKIYEALLALLKANKARIITRLMIETTIKCAISEKFNFVQPPVIIVTEIDNNPKESKYLQFNWAAFFGGENRCYPNIEQWNEVLLRQLIETSRWITNNRSTNKILLKGSRRLSSEMAIGHVFSAVAGFTIEMEYREEKMSTIDCPDSGTPDYLFETTYKSGAGERLIVTVGIMKENLKLEVDRFIERIEQGSCSELNLFSASPLVSAKQANLAAEKIKKEIMAAVVKSNANHIDLFYAGPAYLALFFGHIRNTLPRIQCFERVKVNVYVPTCLI